MSGLLHRSRVGDLVRVKRRLLEVPYSSTVGDVIAAFLAHDVVAMPVAAPPGEWIGAGGTTIVVKDPASGAARKQYIGFVSVLDVLMHIAERPGDLAGALDAPVASLIGHSQEGLSLWTLSPDTSLYDAMEPLSQGVHRLLAPGEDAVDRTPGVEVAEASVSYRLVSQTDIVRFMLDRARELGPIMSRPIQEVGVIHHGVLAVPASMRILDAVRCMRSVAITAVAIVETDPSETAAGVSTLVQGVGRRLVGTLSASDLRGCTGDVLAALPHLTVLEFLEKMAMARRFGFGTVFVSKPAASGTDSPRGVRLSSGRVSSSLTPREGEVAGLRKPVTCLATASLVTILAEALDNRVHRVWVVDKAGLLTGLISFSDIIRAIRRELGPPEQAPVPSQAAASL